MTYDFKEARQCEKRKLNWKDFLPTALMIASVLMLFALATHELVKEGGALDKSLGITADQHHGVANNRGK